MNTPVTNVPTIPVSWGEYLDRMSILAIKTHRLRGAAARANVERDIEQLRQVALHPSGVAELEAALLAVNTRLWRIEDLILREGGRTGFRFAICDAGASNLSRKR